MDDSKSPSTQVNKNAQNPNGQRSTMANTGTVGAFTPPNADMHSTKNIKIDPVSNIGHNRFDMD